MRPLETVLVTPHRMGSRATLVYLCSRVTEYKAYVDVGTLLFDEQVFGSRLSFEAAFSFDKIKAPRFGELKVWCVFSVPGWPYEG